MESAAISGQRVGWVDCCKGICILLVVYGHIVGGLDASGALAGDTVFGALRKWVYLFHIPAFFFLSGLFARKACDRPLLEFLQNRARVLLYPYLVWTLIVVVSQAAVSSMVNTPASPLRALECLWQPYGVGLWFLYSLFLVSLLFNRLLRWRVPVIAGLLIGLIGYVLYFHKVFGVWYIFNESWGFAIYFLIGGYYPGIVSAPLRNARRPFFLAAAIVLFAVMTLLSPLSVDPLGMLKLVKALLGISGVVCVAMALSQTAVGARLAFLGIYSLEIYLAHPLWGTASRAVLLRAGVHSHPLLVGSGVTLGVIGSLATAVACKRLNFPYLFRWPVRPRLASNPQP